jgi:hypothetical protein
LRIWWFAPVGGLIDFGGLVVKKVFAGTATIAGLTSVALSSVILATAAFTSSASAADMATKAAPMAPVDPLTASWSFNATTELKYYSWHDSVTTPGTGSNGSELYTPLTLQMNGKVGNVLSIDLVGKGGWVNLNQRSDDLSGSVSTVTDTSLSGTFTYTGLNVLQPFVGFQTNVPTGRAGTNTLPDPDLVEVPTFGQGFDVGGTAGFNFLPSNNWFLTTSVTYLARGGYTRDNGAAAFATPLINPALLAPSNVVNFKPGDLVTILQSVQYSQGSFTQRFTGTVSFEGSTFQDGLELMKPGNTYALTSDTNYTWSDIIGTTTLSASVTHTDATQTTAATNPAVAATIADTATNVYSVTLQHLVPVGDFAIGPTASYLFRDNNGINTAKLEFVPTKQRYSAGLVARYNATPNLTLNARVEGVWSHLDGDLDTDSLRYSAIGGAYLPVAGSPVINGSALWTTIGLNYKL